MKGEKIGMRCSTCFTNDFECRDIPGIHDTISKVIVKIVCEACATSHSYLVLHVYYALMQVCVLCPKDLIACS